MSQGPLAGVRVVDLSQIVSGPMAAAMLADQGADVIKVETPAGDPVRRLGPARGDLSAMFIAVNRGKRGIALDLKQRDGCAVLEKLVASADVLIENFRPGAIDRLGFGYERCRDLNPRLIFASITGFGPDGPYANVRVYDPIVQAVSGMAATQTDRDGKPSLIKTLVADKLTALTAAQAITAALFARTRTGAGQRLDVAMLDAAIAFNWPEGMYNHSFLDDPLPPFPEYGAMARLWAAADGQVAIAFLQDSEYVAMCAALELPHLAVDPRLRSMPGRMAHQAEWAPQFATALAARDRNALMAAFGGTGAAGGRVNACADMPDDPQVRHNGAVTEIAHGDAGRVRAARHPSRFAGTPVRAPSPAPRLGEHGGAVLAELGYAPDEVARLQASGAVPLPSPGRTR